MTPSDAEYSAFVGYHRPAEFRYAESILKRHFVRLDLVYVEEVNGLASPLEIMHKFVAGIALF